MSVGEPLTFDVPSLGGGLNQGLPITAIEDSEAVALENFFTFGTKAKRRRGSSQITSSAYSEALTALFAYKRATGAWLLLVGTLTGIAKLDGSALVALPVFDGGSYASSTHPWHFRQYKDEVLAARKSAGTLKRVTADSVMDAGIPEPSSSPTLADGGAGVLAAGDYGYVVTFLNRTTEAEGNPSDVVTITLGANKQVSLTNIPVSTNGQVNGRNIYRTVKDQAGKYFFVAQLADNFTTSYVDNVDQDDLGDEASFDNGEPPDLVELVEMWLERGWVSDGTDLFFSQIGNPQGYGEFDIIQVYPDDGHEIRGLLAFGARLMVGKTNAMHFIARAGGTFTLQTLSDKHGLMAAHTLQTAEGLIFWYSGDNIMRSEGVNVHSITTTKLRTALDAIPAAMKEKAIGFVNPEESQYWFVCSAGSETENEVAYIYNYKTDSWSGPHDWPFGAVNYVGSFFDENLERIIYAVGEDANVWQLNTGRKDGSSFISARIRTKGYGFDSPGVMKGLRRLSLLCSQIAETVTVRAYVDGSSTAAAERTGVSLNVPDAWKRIALHTLGTLGAVVQVEVEYAGESDFELEALLLELQAFPARRGKVL